MVDCWVFTLGWVQIKFSTFDECHFAYNHYNPRQSAYDFEQSSPIIPTSHIITLLLCYQISSLRFAYHQFFYHSFDRSPRHSKSSLLRLGILSRRLRSSEFAQFIIQRLFINPKWLNWNASRRQGVTAMFFA